MEKRRSTWGATAPDSAKLLTGMTRLALVSRRAPKVGLGVDFTVNAGVELSKRDEFVKDVEGWVGRSETLISHHFLFNLSCFRVRVEAWASRISILSARTQATRQLALDREHTDLVWFGQDVCMCKCLAGAKNRNSYFLNLIWTNLTASSMVEQPAYPGWKAPRFIAIYQLLRLLLTNNYLKQNVLRYIFGEETHTYIAKYIDIIT